MKKSESKSQKASVKTARKSSRSQVAAVNGSHRNGAPSEKLPVRRNAYGIPDYRLEVLDCSTVEEWVDGQFRYNVDGDLSAEPPSLRESKYLNKEQSTRCANRST